jgi:prepilin-type processing-associated H-X9-DG protein
MVQPYYSGSMVTIGPRWRFTGSAATALGKTNYVVNGGYRGLGFNFDAYAGPLAIRSQHTWASVSDGTSNTVLFGEALGDPRTTTTSRHAYAWMYGGSVFNEWLITGTQAGIDSRNPWAFGSKHTNSSNFAMCDGSVRSMRDPLSNWLTFVYACGISDGQTFDPSAL